MSIYIPEEGDWVRGYGGRLNHLVISTVDTHGNTGTFRTNFACGKYSDCVEFGKDHGKGNCPKCEAAQHSVHPTASGESDEGESPNLGGG